MRLRSERPPAPEVLTFPPQVAGLVEKMTMAQRILFKARIGSGSTDAQMVTTAKAILGA